MNLHKVSESHVALEHGFVSHQEKMPDIILCWNVDESRSREEPKACEWRGPSSTLTWRLSSALSMSFQILLCTQLNKRQSISHPATQPGQERAHEPSSLFLFPDAVALLQNTICSPPIRFPHPAIPSCNISCAFTSSRHGARKDYQSTYPSQGVDEEEPSRCLQ
jgi:hypothetical protein